jgi:hypothetical protein
MFLVEQKFHQIHTQTKQTHFATIRLSKPHLKNIQSISCNIAGPSGQCKQKAHQYIFTGLRTNTVI